MNYYRKSRLKTTTDVRINSTVLYILCNTFSIRFWSEVLKHSIKVWRVCRLKAISFQKTRMFGCWHFSFNSFCIMDEIIWVIRQMVEDSNCFWFYKIPLYLLVLCFLQFTLNLGDLFKFLRKILYCSANLVSALGSWNLITYFYMMNCFNLILNDNLVRSV